MAERDFLIQAFNDCTERMQAGESLDGCLHRYPQHAAELRPMLLGAEAVRRARVPVHEAEQAQVSARFRFEASLQEETGKQRGGLPALRYAAAAVAVFFISFGALTALAQSALPGDTLYGLKRAGEQVLMALAGSPDDGRLNDRRIAEIEALLADGRAETVTFEGEVGAQNGPDWQIGGLSITVTADIASAGDIRTGDRVRVSGYTMPAGGLIAESLLLLERGLQPPTSTPTAFPTRTALPTATPSSAPPPTATTLPTATSTDDHEDDPAGDGSNGHDNSGPPGN